MSRKNLSRTVIEGGRYHRNCWMRRASHGIARAATRDWLDRVALDLEEADATVAPTRPRVHKMFRDKLGPAHRWLLAQVGRPWSKVYSELCMRFDTRTVAGRHVVHDHMLQWVRRHGEPHKVRPELKPYQPVHVVLRVVDEVGSLRKRHMYKALREATISVALRELHDRRDGAFRIIHISVQHNHVHLIVEADNKRALSRGMQSFQISAAKHLNRAVTIASMKAARNGLPLTREQRSELSGRRRRGTVFPDRFHQEIIKTPKQARHTLAYVLNNWRKHREDRGVLERTWNVDPYSTGVLFDGWKEREDAYVLWRWRDTYDPLVVYLPKTWLLREGWRKHGLVGFRDVPSEKQAQLQRADAAA